MSRKKRAHVRGGKGRVLRRQASRHTPSTLSRALLEWGGGALQKIDDPDHAALVLATLSCSGLLQVIPFTAAKRQAPLLVRHIVKALGEIGYEARAVDVEVVAFDDTGNALGALGSRIPAHYPDGRWDGYQVIYVPDKHLVFDPMIGVGDFHRHKNTRYPLLANMPDEPSQGYRFDLRTGDLRLTYRVTELGERVEDSEAMREAFLTVDANLAVARDHLTSTYAALCADIALRREREQRCSDTP